MSDKPTKQQSKKPPAREPIAVGILIFPGDHPISVPGKPCCSSVTSRLDESAGPRERHEIEYHPWLRAFRVSHHANDKTEVAYIPEGRVDVWRPLTPKT